MQNIGTAESGLKLVRTHIGEDLPKVKEGCVELRQVLFWNKTCGISYIPLFQKG
jgi:hypothetical protein